MPGSPLNRKLKKFVVANSGEWLEQAPAVLGDLDGTVATGVNGMVYARFTNGQVIEAFNRIAPLVFDLQVIVGRSKSLPNTWQVVMVRENYLTPAADGAISEHHTQHEFPNQDTVWVDRKQVTSLTVLVNDPDNYIVSIYGALVRTKNGIVMIENQELDISSYVPVSGAVYISIECDEDGVLSVNEGTPFMAPGAAQLSDVPLPGPGKYTISFIMLYDVMESLTNDMIGLPVPLITDYDGIDTGYQINEADADTPLDADKFGFWDVVDLVLKNITWANIKATLKTYFDTLYKDINETYTYEVLTYETNLPNKTIGLPTVNVQGVLAVATGIGTWIASEDGVFESVMIYCEENGSAGSTIVDVNKNGTTIFTTQANRPTFLNTDSVTIESNAPDVLTFEKGDIITLDIDAVATGASDLTVTVLVYGYNDMDFIVDNDGVPVTESEFVEVV